MLVRGLLLSVVIHLDRAHTTRATDSRDRFFFVRTTCPDALRNSRDRVWHAAVSSASADAK